MENFNNLQFTDLSNANNGKNLNLIQRDLYADMQVTLRDKAAILLQRRIDRNLADNAMTRVNNVNRHLLTAKYAELFVDYEVKDTFFQRCDKTLDRFVKVVSAIFESDTMQPTSGSDQNRYTFNLIRTLIKAYGLEITAINKSDYLATGSRRKTENDYIAVASRLMSDSTATRQCGIAATVLTDLGFCNAKFNDQNKMIGITLNADSIIFHKMLQMVIDGK